MSKGKNRSKNRSTSAGKTYLDPDIKALQIGNFGSAKDVAAQPFQMFTGERVAGFTPTQVGAQQRSVDFSNSGVGRGLMESASTAANAAGGYSPFMISAPSYSATGARPVQQVSFSPTQTSTAGFERMDAAQAGDAGTVAMPGRDTIRDVSFAGLNDGDITRFMNPYTSEVVNTTLADLNRQQQIDQSLADAAARKNKSFGGTGSAVERQLIGERYGREAASTAAGLRSSGYAQALTAAQGEAQRAQQAQIQNQGADTAFAGITRDLSLANQTSAQADAARRQEAAINNQTAANQTGQFNASEQNRIAGDNSRGLLESATTNANIGREMSLFDAGGANDAARFNAEQNFAAQSQNQQAQGDAARIHTEAAQTLASLSDQERSQMLQDIQVAGDVGDAEQRLKQSLLDFGFSEFEAQRQYPLIMQGLLNETAGILGMPNIGENSSKGGGSSSGFNIGIPIPGT